VVRRLRLGRFFSSRGPLFLRTWCDCEDLLEVSEVLVVVVVVDLSGRSDLSWEGGEAAWERAIVDEVVMVMREEEEEEEGEEEEVVRGRRFNERG
jgi:hypothetical protein